jgi:NADPH:quinone reductase-like Zn-dependent oxidoreductase
MMRAIVVERYGGREQLQLRDIPVPSIGPADVLVEVAAAGVNYVDAMFREGYYGTNQFPLVMGSDFAGTIVQVGAEVTDLAPGDEVYGYKLFGNGTYAEYVSVPASYVARKPTNLSFVEAAALPCVGLTAYEALEKLKLQKGETILIAGAAGGVGSLAVQIAVDRGARVIATASQNNHEYLRHLGAAEVIDYTTEDFVQALRAHHPDGIDAVLSCFGGETKQRSPQVLRDGGRLVWITGDEQAGPPMERFIQGGYQGGIPDRRVLSALAQLFEAKRLSVWIDGVFPLEQAALAHERVETGHVRGKLVVQVKREEV